MKPSQLVAIVQRLQTMAAQDSDIEVRRFEKDGVEKAIVTFNQETSSFELVDVETNQTFQFDDIDLVTIEILKCYKIKIITVSKATAQSVCAVAFQYIR